jgi:hypothetical protein
MCSTSIGERRAGAKKQLVLKNPHGCPSDLSCCKCRAVTPRDLPRCPAGHGTCRDCMTAHVRSSYTRMTAAARASSLRIRCPSQGCDHTWTSLLGLGLPYSADPALVTAFEESTEASVREVSGLKGPLLFMEESRLMIGLGAAFSADHTDPFKSILEGLALGCPAHDSYAACRCQANQLRGLIETLRPGAALVQRRDRHPAGCYYDYLHGGYNTVIYAPLRHLRLEAFFWDSRATDVSRPAGDDCIVCLEAEGAYRRSRCGHWFHELCILTWFAQGSESKETCPTCRWEWMEGDVPDRGGAYCRSP